MASASPILKSWPFRILGLSAFCKNGPDNQEPITINWRAALAPTGMSQAAEWRCYNGGYHGYRSSSFGWLVVGCSQSCRPDDREDGDETGPTSSRRSAWKKGARGRNGE